ncbi:MAG: U32 family peptidase [Firmicutes bacterium]|nr:U32 family peptidase [Bacillota bacterium]
MRLAVPLSAPGEGRLLFAAGAAEFYCGLQTDEWQAGFGNHDSISRRQGRANLSTYDELHKLLLETASLGAPLFLTLNGSYTQEQLPLVLETAEIYQEMGGAGVMITDIALLILLQKRHSKLKRALSLLAAVSSCSALEFYLDLGIERVVFPRFMSPAQMGLIMKRYPHIEAEAIVWLDKCRFIDGYCRFLHPVGYRDCTGLKNEPPQGCLYVYDTQYGLPACFELLGEPPPLPACAACHLEALEQAGVKIFKLGGRGREMEIRLSGVRFLTAAKGKTNGTEIRELYRQSFGAPCNAEICYYG